MEGNNIIWQLMEVKSPEIEHSVSVVAAKNIPYVSAGNRLQTLNIYLPKTPENETLIGTKVVTLPKNISASHKFVVHIHGGAWRDPMLLADSIEPTVACAYEQESNNPIVGFISLNYTLTQFPTHPANPYNTLEDNHSDPAREAVHPQHVKDIYLVLHFLNTIGLKDHSYILTGHSAGACLAFQSSLMEPNYFGLQNVTMPPVPVATVGLNGLYDLPALVYHPDEAHIVTSNDYNLMLQNAFGKDESIWATASPALFDTNIINQRVLNNKAPRLVLIDQSVNDQLVSMNQRDLLEANLKKVTSMRVVIGKRCESRHAVPWQKGLMIWNTILDVLEELSKS